MLTPMMMSRSAVGDIREFFCVLNSNAEMLEELVELDLIVSATEVAVNNICCTYN
jgi:hypothetical protein